MLHQFTVNELNALPGMGADPECAQRRPDRWFCSLSEEIIGDYLIIPLTSVELLTSEAYLMNNRCRDYLDLCQSREYCLFSIRSFSDEPVATLGLKNENGYWCFDICLGPSRSDVLEETIQYLDQDAELQTETFSTDIYYVAHEVVRLMNASEVVRQ